MPEQSLPTRGKSITSEDRDWPLSFAKVRTRLLSTTLTKALAADTDKHKRDLALAALCQVRGIVASLEEASK
jgi:hypothetical protein